MIKILIADNQMLTRAGLMAILAGCEDLFILGYAKNPAELIQMMTAHTPDVVIIDHFFNGNFSAQEVQIIHSRFPEVHVLVLSAGKQKNEIIELLGFGIKSYVSKECAKEELIEAVYTTSKGEKFFCERTMQLLFEDKLAPKKIGDIPSLSSRETEIVQLIAAGKANKEIAEKLFLSIHTIKTHRKNIIKKLGFTFKNASELILLISYLNDLFI